MLPEQSSLFPQLLGFKAQDHKKVVVEIAAAEIWNCCCYHWDPPKSIKNNPSHRPRTVEVVPAAIGLEALAQTPEIVVRTVATGSVAVAAPVVYPASIQDSLPALN